MNRTVSKMNRRDVLRGASLLAVAAAIPIGTARAQDRSSVSIWYGQPEFADALAPAWADFEANNPQFKLDIRYIQAPQYPAALTMGLAADELPDAVGSWLSGAISLRNVAQNGYILPADELIDASKLTPVARSVVSFDDKVWGAPFAGYTIGIYYHKDVFDKNGLVAPTTWDEFLAVCKALKDAGITPFAMGAQDGLLPSFFINLAVNSVLGAEGVQQLCDGTRKLTDPDLVACAQYMLDMKQYFNEGFEAVSYAEAKALFARGSAAMIVGGNQDFAGYHAINPDIQVGIFGFPAPKGERRVTTTGIDMVFSVSKTAKNPDGAAAFVKWLGSEGGQQLLGNALGRPTLEGILPEGDGPMAIAGRMMIAAGNPDTPVWDSLPEVNNFRFALAQNGTGIFFGSLTPQSFMELAQATFSGAAA